jgi:hypothetical protein
MVNKEMNGFSARAEELLKRAVQEFVPPDIDSAKEILPLARRLYEGLGVPPEDAKRASKLVEENLFGGTAPQQAAASDALDSLWKAQRGLPLQRDNNNK